jgi:NADPH:quinone reductase-like Zn-dependent oxidoreductase
MDRAFEMHVQRAGPASSLRPREVTLAPPGPGEARVSIEAAGVAYADIVMRRGLYAGHAPPVTPGYDFIGRIEAFGEGVSGFQLGQRVAAVTVSGAYATRRNVDARWLVPAPDSVSPAALVAATLNGVTAFQMLHRIGNAAPGESVLVHGAAGGVGVLMLDLARNAGACAIGAMSAAKAEVVAARGATPLDRAMPRRALHRAISAASGGGVAAAFDHVGGAHFRDISMPALRPGGVGVLYGGYDATRGGRVRPFAIASLIAGSGSYSAYNLFNTSRTVAGYSAPAWRDARRVAFRSDLARVLELVDLGIVTPLIGATFPLSEAAEAHRQLEARAVAGKIVLTMEGLH